MPNSLDKKDQVLLKFMELTISNVNTCLAGQYALFKILVEKKIVSEAELLTYMRDSKKLPETKLGATVLQEMLEPEWLQNIDLEKTSEDILESYKNKIFNIVMPEHWKDGGSQPPNIDSKNNAFLCCSLIYQRYGILPDSIVCTIKSGVFIIYQKNNTSLYIEAYNDGDIGSLVCTNKTTTHCEDIINFNFDPCITAFNKP